MQFRLADYLNKNPKFLWTNTDFLKEALRYIYTSNYLNGIKITGTVTDGQTLVYSNADSAWEPGGGSSDATSLQGVSLAATPPSINQYLKYNGTKWLPSDLATGDPITRGSQGILAVSVTGQLINPTGTVGQSVKINSSGDPVFVTAFPNVVAYPDDLVAQSGAVTVATYTVSSADSSFKVGGYVNITAIVTDVLNFQVQWTDENNVSTTQIFSPTGVTAHNLATTGFFTFPDITIRAKATTTITISTILAVGGGTITYDTGGCITQVK